MLSFTPPLSNSFLAVPSLSLDELTDHHVSSLTPKKPANPKLDQFPLCLCPPKATYTTLISKSCRSHTQHISPLLRSRPMQTYIDFQPQLFEDLPLCFLRLILCHKPQVQCIITLFSSRFHLTSSALSLNVGVHVSVHCKITRYHVS